MAGIRKIKAGSLIETLVAITLLMTAVIIGTIIFINVTHSSYTGNKVRAQLILDKISRETTVSQTYIDEEINEETLIIKKKVEPYDGYEHLQILSFKVYDHSQHLLAEKKQVILITQ